MVIENVLRADETPKPSYQCRTAVVPRSYRQSWTDRDRELRPRSDSFVTIMTDRGGVLWSGTSAKNDRHSVTWVLTSPLRSKCLCWPMEIELTCKTFSSNFMLHLIIIKWSSIHVRLRWWYMIGLFGRSWYIRHKQIAKSLRLLWHVLTCPWPRYSAVVWDGFCGFKPWFILCLSHCSDVFNINLHLTVL